MRSLSVWSISCLRGPYGVLKSCTFSIRSWCVSAGQSELRSDSSCETFVVSWIKIFQQILFLGIVNVFHLEVKSSEMGNECEYTKLATHNKYFPQTPNTPSCFLIIELLTVYELPSPIMSALCVNGSLRCS